MALFSDLKELNKEWEEAGPLKKVIIIILLFLTISSLTSLSDAVFKWKGFIFDGIEFYKNWISQPLQDLFSVIKIKLSDTSTDFIIVYNLFNSNIVKRYLANNNYFLSDSIWSILFVLYIYLFPLYTSILLIEHFDELIINPVLVVISYPILLSLLIIISGLSDVHGKSQIKRSLSRLWAPVFLPILIVLILAAINTGLSKPM